MKDFAMGEYATEQERFWAGGFGGEFVDRFRDVSLVDYGFVYHRDPNFPQDDISWFLTVKSP